MMRCAI